MHWMHNFQWLDALGASCYALNEKFSIPLSNRADERTSWFHAIFPRGGMVIRFLGRRQQVHSYLALHGVPKR